MARRVQGLDDDARELPGQILQQIRQVSSRGGGVTLDLGGEPPGAWRRASHGRAGYRKGFSAKPGRRPRQSRRRTVVRPVSDHSDVSPNP